MNIVKLFAKSIKGLLYLANIAGLIWWTFRSIEEYNTWKTASNLVLQYGDDGEGNVRFPVVTICPVISSFHNNSNNLMWKKQYSCKKVFS